MNQEINAVDQVLAQLAKALGPLAPYAKAVITALLGVAQLLVQLAVTGHVSSTALTLAVGAAVLAVVVYLVPNLQRKPPSPPKAPSAPKPTEAPAPKTAG